MSRSIWKGPYVEASLLRSLSAQSSKKIIKVYSRRSVILESFVGKLLYIHNGKKFIPVMITENMVGHKLGEFALTRCLAKHTSKHAKRLPNRKLS